jgi:hypothetical protein
VKQPFQMRALSLAILAVNLSHLSYAQVSDYDRAQAVRTRVLDQLPTDVASLKGSYFSKLMLRFTKPDSQLVLVIYSGWKSELVSYTFPDLGGKTLSEYVWDMVRSHPQMRDEEIAAGAKVMTKRAFVDSRKVERTIAELQKIKISPFPGPVVPLDEYSTYEYRWESPEGESVHYRAYGVFNQRPTDKLVHWMIRFRNSFILP